jgi:hypothetical protein
MPKGNFPPINYPFNRSPQDIAIVRADLWTGGGDGELHE